MKSPATPQADPPPSKVKRSDIRNRKLPLAALDAELGTISDAKLAHKYNVSPAHVRDRRRELGISPCKGPAKGQGGRPPGPKRVNLGTLRVLESTAAWLNARGQTAAQALDALCGSNIASQTAAPKTSNLTP